MFLLPSYVSPEGERRQIKFGVSVPNFGDHLGSDSIRKVCDASEEMGFDSVWTTDHIVTPAGTLTPYKTIYESVAVLAYMAGITTRVFIGT